jgi:hypothetical protein
MHSIWSAGKWRIRSHAASSFNSLARIRLFARQGIFAKLGNLPYGRSLFLQKQRCRVVYGGAGGESGADECPGRASIEALIMERLCAFIRKLHRQRGDQSAGGKSQQTGEGCFEKGT